MATVNKELESLTLDEIIEASNRFLMGWHDPKYDGHNYRIKGLNKRRAEYGLEPLTKEQSVAYRIQYVQKHYTVDEIICTLQEYLEHNKVADMRWSGIELFGCRFGREYTKIFKELVGASVWRKISEAARVDKLVKTQIDVHGGVGVAGKDAYDKMVMTKITKSQADIELNGESSNEFASNVEKVVYSKLVSKFGRDDIVYQYGIHPYDKRYPYPCDFYVKSKDLFIELNIHFSHGHHWFDEKNSEDVKLADSWKNSSKVKVQKQYKTWVLTDIEKRNKAKKSKIKYLVFWDKKHFHDDRVKNGHLIRKYVPRLKDFNEWFLDFDCDYEKFIEVHPENTY